MSCENEESIPIICDTYRENLIGKSNQIIRGFSIFPNELPEKWSLKEINVSFDKEGLFPLPQEKKNRLPKITKETNNFTFDKKTFSKKHSLKYDLDNLNENDLQEWFDTYEFDDYLNKIEEKL